MFLFIMTNLSSNYANLFLYVNWGFVSIFSASNYLDPQFSKAQIINLYLIFVRIWEVCAPYNWCLFNRSAVQRVENVTLPDAVILEVIPETELSCRMFQKSCQQLRQWICFHDRQYVCNLTLDLRWHSVPYFRLWYQYLNCDVTSSIRCTFCRLNKNL